MLKKMLFVLASACVGTATILFLIFSKGLPAQETISFVTFYSFLGFAGLWGIIFD